MTEKIVQMKTWNSFEYQGSYYYIEIFHFSNNTVKAFAKKTNPFNNGVLADLDQPIGTGSDPINPTKATIKAIHNLRQQYT